MTEFPAWYGPKGGDPIWCRSALEAQEGWVQHFGRYDTQIGQFVHDEPLDHDGDGKKGGSRKQSGPSIKALRTEYERCFGKKPFNGWSEAVLVEKLKAA